MKFKFVDLSFLMPWIACSSGNFRWALCSHFYGSNVNFNDTRICLLDMAIMMR